MCITACLWCVCASLHVYGVCVHHCMSMVCVWVCVCSIINLLHVQNNNSVREFMAFTSELLVERTQAGQRQAVKEQGSE